VCGFAKSKRCCPHSRRLQYKVLIGVVLDGNVRCVPFRVQFIDTSTGHGGGHISSLSLALPTCYRCRKVPKIDSLTTRPIKTKEYKHAASRGNARDAVNTSTWHTTMKHITATTRVLPSKCSVVTASVFLFSRPFVSITLLHSMVSEWNGSRHRKDVMGQPHASDPKAISGHRRPPRLLRPVHRDATATQTRRDTPRDTSARVRT
jgi:hypothetical protein